MCLTAQWIKYLESTTMQEFFMENKKYELVAIAQDASAYSQGKMAVYRPVGTNNYFVRPLMELISYLPKDKKLEATITHRLQLYKKLFVGRTDVYAHRYFNKKQQKDVYFPVTHFKNHRPLKGKEGWIPLSDPDIRSHLEGRQFIGLYPMYEDNTCKFVVIDIDKQNWQDICSAINQVCSNYAIPVLMEVSQSGNGCHIWIFFSTKIKAQKARKLADNILQATMEIYPSMPLSAFDRLFPSQDLIQSDKTGNLIAAPLQGQRRKENKTVFVDAHFRPYQQQWKILENIVRLNEKQTDQLISKLQTEQQINIISDEEEDTHELSLGKIVYFEQLTIIKSNMLFISKSSLSSTQIAYLKTMGSFWNPQFFKRQRQRLSTFKTPRIIDLSVELPDFICLPRGLEDGLEKLSTHIEWKDQTIKGNAINVSFVGELKSEQEKATAELLKNSNGVLAARTGFGKTVVAAKIIAARKVSTLILVNNRELAQQWKKQLKNFLNINGKPLIKEYTATGRKRKKDMIGSFYGSTHNRSGVIDIATIQSFKGTKEEQAILNDYGMVIFDEVHHVPAFSYDEVIKNIGAHYLYGLSATPYRQDGLSKIITLRMGKIRYQTDLVDSRHSLDTIRRVVPRYTNLGLNLPELKVNTLNENYELLAKNDDRNKSILKDITTNLHQKRHILVLTHRVTHLQLLADHLKDSSSFPIYKLYGAQGAKKNHATVEKINDTDTPFVIFATSKYAGEGLDIGALDTIVLAMPNSWKGIIFQTLGRLQRDVTNKKELRVYDYVDILIPPFARMYQKRKKAYEKLNFKIQEDKTSRSSNVSLYEGNYHSILLKRSKQAKHAMISAANLSPFLLWKLIYKNKDHCTVVLHSLSDFYQKKMLSASVSYTLTDNNIPECILFDNKELWLCSDKGFNSDNGIAVCISSPDTVAGFSKIIADEIHEDKL